MPIYPPRELEPYKKKELLSKREKQLLHCLKHNASDEKLHKAAEKLREAHLKVLKAQLQLSRTYCTEDQTPQQKKKVDRIEKENRKWSLITAEEIVEILKKNT